MPFSKVSELPASVKNVLPQHAQEMYKEAFNNAYDQYKDPDQRKGGAGREDTAHRVARSAVKSKYHKGDDNKWHAK